MTPKGLQPIGIDRRRFNEDHGWHPSGVLIGMKPLAGGVATARPPANGWQASGLPLASRPAPMRNSTERHNLSSHQAVEPQWRSTCTSLSIVPRQYRAVARARSHCQSSNFLPLQRKEGKGETPQLRRSFT